MNGLGTLIRMCSLLCLGGFIILPGSTRADLLLFEPGLNYVRVCCNIESLSAYHLTSYHADSLFARRPLATFRRKRVDTDPNGNRVHTVPLIEANGFVQYDWYAICAHPSSEGDREDGGDAAGMCVVVRPCDCDCNQSAFLSIGLSVLNQSRLLAVQLFDNGMHERFPGRVEVDADVWDSAVIERCPNETAAVDRPPSSCEPISRVQLVEEPHRSIPRPARVAFADRSTPEAIRFRASLTLTLPNSTVDLREIAVPLGDFDEVIWNRTDSRFWLIQPIRLPSPLVWLERKAGPVPLSAADARRECRAWSDSGEGDAKHEQTSRRANSGNSDRIRYEMTVLIWMIGFVLVAF